MWTALPTICPSFPIGSGRGSSSLWSVDYDADVLVARAQAADYFEAVREGRDEAGSNSVINELFGRLNEEGKSMADSPVSQNGSAPSST